MAKAKPIRTNPIPTSRTTKPADELRRQVLTDFAALRVPLDEHNFDEQLSRSEQEGLTPLAFLARVIGEQADRRRERAIERRIHDARFPDICTLADFDWQFNARTIDRGQIEQLATCDFFRRKDNLVLVGQSGLGKSRIIKSVARQACVLAHV